LVHNNSDSSGDGSAGDFEDDDRSALRGVHYTQRPTLPQSPHRGAHQTLQFYGHGMPYLKDLEVKGHLIVIEGPDASGRSTHAQLIQAKLEADGHAVLGTGLKRSELISEGIIEAKANLGVGKRTLSLFYAADFADQLENKIIPALEAGYVVLADRYIYTLIARNNVRGIERRWSRSLFGFAMVPDLIFYLDVKPEELVHRVFQKNSILDYYESGMDIGLSDDMYKSFLIYQGKMAKEFEKLKPIFGLQFVDGNRPIEQVDAELQAGIDSFLSRVK
jgi:dTMP kinase